MISCNGLFNIYINNGLKINNPAYNIYKDDSALFFFKN